MEIEGKEKTKEKRAMRRDKSIHEKIEKRRKWKEEMVENQRIMD